MSTQELYEHITTNMIYDGTDMYWRHSGTGRVRDAVGSYRNDGHIQCRLYNTDFQLHRLIWLYVYGELPKGEIDHINRIKDDNRIDNLSDVSHITNARNRGLSKSRNNEFVGVTFHKQYGKYRADIVVGEQIYLGLYKTLEEAISARLFAESYYDFLTR